jgi:hypothetical protein
MEKFFGERSSRGFLELAEELDFLLAVGAGATFLALTFAH